MDQIFNAPVDQVAGNNIYNYSPPSWSSQSDQQLYAAREHHKQLIWDARKRLFFNYPNLFLALGFLGLVAYSLFTLSNIAAAGMFSELENNVPFPVMVAYIFLAVGLPMHLVHKKREREGAIIFNSKLCIREIDIVLNARSR